MSIKCREDVFPRLTAALYTHKKSQTNSQDYYLLYYCKDEAKFKGLLKQTGEIFYPKRI
jgi:hypothetical protein